MHTGIYSITSPSGAQYVGSTVNFSTRWRLHRHLLTKGVHHNKGLRRAAAKYGLESLQFKKILICRINDLLFFEQRAIDILKPKYNACRIAGSQLGQRQSEESKAKISASKTGIPVHTQEHRAHLSNRMKGNTIMIGRKLSEATRAKISAASGARTYGGFEHDDLREEERDSLAADYVAGIGLIDLEKKYGSDHRVLRRILISKGVIIRPRGRTIKSERYRADLNAR